MHTPQSLADVLERDYFPMPDGAKLYLAEHEWKMVITALRASPSEAVERDAARYRWLRNQHDAFWVRFRADDGLECDLFGHDLDAAIDAAPSRSPQQEEKT